MKEIYLAGGCFWGIEEYFRQRDGILETKVGYANSSVEHPTYERVCTGTTNAVETVYVKYDEAVITLTAVLDKFFRIMDPTQWMRQGFDVGTQYRNGVYYVQEDDVSAIREAMDLAEERLKKPLVTEVKPLENFYLAEEGHQEYLRKNPGGYCHVDMSL